MDNDFLNRFPYIDPHDDRLKKLGIEHVVAEQTHGYLEYHGGYAGEWAIVGDYVVITSKQDDEHLGGIEVWELSVAQQWQRDAIELWDEMPADERDTGTAVMETQPEEAEVVRG